MSRSVSFEVRCTPSEKAAWKHAAGRRGLSELARRALVTYLEHRDRPEAPPPLSPVVSPNPRVTVGGSAERAAALLARPPARPARPFTKQESTR